MTMKTLLARGACAVSLLALASAAMAQPAAAPAAPAGPPITQGPPIAGVCVFSFDNVLGASALGRAVAARLQQLAQQANAELTTEQTTIQTDIRALEAGRATMDPAIYEQRAGTIQLRQRALERKAEQRDRELQATQQKALNRVAQEVNPLVQTVYQQKTCSILLNGQAVMALNPAMDLTPQVTTLLNARIQSITFDRERLDTPAAGAPPAVTRPQ